MNVINQWKKSEFILREHRTASLESTTCEASTQQTHLTILAAVLRHLILLQNADLELQLMYCIPPAFPRTRLQSMAFLFKCYLETHKYEWISTSY